MKTVPAYVQEPFAKSSSKTENNKYIQIAKLTQSENITINKLCEWYYESN